MTKIRVLAVMSVMLVALFATGIVMAGGMKFGTHMTGDQEVPARDTRAQGQANFKLSDDGETMSYKVIVANIHNVVAAHIHIAPAGENGPVVVWLVGANAPEPGPFPVGGGRTQGGVGEGTFTADNFSGPLAGQPMSALVDAIIEGNAYVNVHTNDGIDPDNTGPGDFPGGEIRGQIELRGKAR
ncbi:MAG: CHRD domain-containing protein [Dehalococcoidia bacterium]